ncbi:MAG TPA: PLP-dependent aspartate aminotransferase family protein [Candidatus Brocadiia bacterium]|nr:PLP-dependent aspartate aminotransferase family protein [Candidatus Brocadiia bacterium]
MRPETKAVHTGVRKDDQYNSVITPIYPTTTFEYTDIGKNKGFDYTRCANPTRQGLEENIAALESGTAAWATASGMAAISTVILTLRSGDHIVAPRDIYGGSFRLMAKVLPGLGIQTSFIDMREPENVSAALRSNTKMVWIETPSNPLLYLTDVEAVTKIAREKGVMTVADNTFATPYFQRPLEQGVDVVVHSTTKYINGHSDVIGGAIIAKDETIARHINLMYRALGTACSPFDAWLVLRGVKTLPQRMEAHQRNAMAIARFLQGHPGVEKVFYPGLESHPQRELAKRQMSGFGGIVSFEVKGGLEAARACLKAVKVFTLAVSLGGVEALIEHAATMSHDAMTPEARARAGITDGLLRCSPGIEHPDDLIEDLSQALESAKVRT